MHIVKMIMSGYVNGLKIGLVCSVKDEKVIMRIARFCSMNKGLTFDP